MESLKRIYLASVFSKILTIANRVFILPLVATVLGPIDFASYVLLVSAIAFLSGMDVGLGGGTLNKISDAYRRGSFGEISALVRQAYVMVGSVCLFAMLVGLVAHFHFNFLPVAENVFSSISSTSAISVLVICISIVTQCMFTMSVKILQGISRQAVANVLGGLVNLMFCAAILIFLLADSRSLQRLSVLTLFFTSFAQLFTVFITLKYTRDLCAKDSVMSISDKVKSGILFSSALPFGMIAISNFVERESLKWVLGSIGDLNAVARFGIYSQINFALIGIVQMLLIPFWPMLLKTEGDNVAQKGVLNRALKTLIVVSGLMLLGALGVTLFAQMLSLKVFGAQFGWTSFEWICYGIYLIATIPKNVFFPLVVGLGAVKKAAISCVSEMLLLVLFVLFGFHRNGLGITFLSMALISLLISFPVFSGVIWKRYLFLKNVVNK